MNLRIPRPLQRLLLILLTLTLFIILTLLLEPRHRSLSCRSNHGFWSCLTLPLRSPFLDPTHVSTVAEEQEVGETQSVLADGSVRFTRRLKREAPPSVLVLVLTGGGHGWSRDFQSTRRSVYDFLDLLASTGLEMKEVALGLLTESEEEFELLKKATDEIALGRVTVVQWWRGREVDFGAATVDRSNDELMKADAARARNYLMARALLDEEHIVWVDPGVVEFSTGLVQRMISHAQNNTELGVITARCEKAGNANYDTDTWAIDPVWGGLRPDAGCPQGRGDEEGKMIAELRRFQEQVPELIRGTVDGDVVPVHSVGGMILYIRAGLVRQGLMFPWWKPVGASWAGEGWFGLDTEGLCAVSRYMKGGECYVLGGTNKVRQSDWG